MNNAKININYFDLENNLSLESVWADKEGELYKIKNIPFFAPNIAYDDLVSVEEEDGALFLDKVVSRSGNSTIHIIIFNEKKFNSIVGEIEKLKCGWEGSHINKYVVVNIPKNLNYNIVKDYLELGREANIFDYEESYLSEEHYEELL